MERYTVTAQVQDKETAEWTVLGHINVMAECHEQHDPYTTTLVGISKAGSARLREFFKQHADAHINVMAGPYSPRLIGWRVHNA